MLIQEEELNWALPSHLAFESRSGKELSFFRLQKMHLGHHKTFWVSWNQWHWNCTPWGEKINKIELMHIHQQLPSLEWKLYPNVLGENLALGNYSSLLKQKYFFCLKTMVLCWLVDSPYSKIRIYLRISTLLFSIWFVRELKFQPGWLTIFFFFSEYEYWLWPLNGVSCHHKLKSCLIWIWGWNETRWSTILQHLPETTLLSLIK